VLVAPEAVVAAVVVAQEAAVVAQGAAETVNRRSQLGSDPGLAPMPGRGLLYTPCPASPVSLPAPDALCPYVRAPD
jgi:hypothetical protein